MSENTRGNRGNVGESSCGDRIKARHSTEGKGLSLKAFARTLVKSGDQDAKDWFDSKAGAANVSRSEKNKTRIHLEKSATKMSRSKKK
jgi:hypothetical protein